MTAKKTNDLLMYEVVYLILKYLTCGSVGDEILVLDRFFKVHICIIDGMMYAD